MSVTTYSLNCQNGILGGYESTMAYTPSEPYYWDSMVVASVNSDGNPLIVNYYLGETLQFVHTWTYDASGNVASLTIS